MGDLNGLLICLNFLSLLIELSIFNIENKLKNSSFIKEKKEGRSKIGFCMGGVERNLT